MDTFYQRLSLQGALQSPSLHLLVLAVHLVFNNFSGSQPMAMHENLLCIYLISEFTVRKRNAMDWGNILGLEIMHNMAILHAEMFPSGFRIFTCFEWADWY